MAIIRQNPTATRHRIARSNGEKVKMHKTRITRSVLASKINEQQKSRLMRKSARAKDNLRTRNVTKQRDQRKVPRSQMMYWLNRKGDTAQDKTFFLPPPRRFRFKFSHLKRKESMKKTLFLLGIVPFGRKAAQVLFETFSSVIFP